MTPWSRATRASSRAPVLSTPTSDPCWKPRPCVRLAGGDRPPLEMPRPRRGFRRGYGPANYSASPRKDVDLLHRTLHVRRQAQEISGRRTITEPKTQAGIRSLSLPGALVAELTTTWKPTPHPDPTVPCSPGVQVCRCGGPTWARRGTRPSRREGIPGLRVHDFGTTPQLPSPVSPTSRSRN